MSIAREVLVEAGHDARANSFNGMNRLLDALADWWLAESEAHFHAGDFDGTTRFIYDMPGMDETPAVRAAAAYLASEGGIA